MRTPGVARAVQCLGMIVDLETRLWHAPEELGPELADAIRRLGAARWLAPDGSADAHAAATAGIDAAMAISFRSGALGAAMDASAISRRVEASDGRLLHALAIDPTAPGASEEVEAARACGACAIWIDPALQAFHPSDTRAMRVLDRAEANQLPVFIGWSGPQPASARMEYARPFLLDEAARAFPRLSIVLSGFGLPFVAETIALMAKHDRVFTTTAGIAARPWELLHALQSARDAGVDAKVLFASGFPFDTPARAVEGLYAVNAMVAGTGLPHLSRAALRDIVERDSISLLGLGTPPTPRLALLERTLAAGLPAARTVASEQQASGDLQP
ncbi:MAG: hypothetical protein RIS86_1778 [Planctomycetota bacterium]